MQRSCGRLRISLKRKPALKATRVSLAQDRLVYVLVCDKKLPYEKGKSRIAYIGTTQNGIWRVAQSVTFRAEHLLTQHGVNELEAHIVTCRRRQNVKTWHKLERALLLTFRKKYGEPPCCNQHGKGIKVTDEFDYFSEPRLKQILEDLS